MKLYGFLTPSGDKLDSAHNGGAGVLVNAATDSLEHIDSLEDDHIDTRPVLKKMKDKSEKKRVKVRATEELSEQTSVLRFGLFLFLLSLSRGHASYLLAMKGHANYSLLR